MYEIKIFSNFSAAHQLKDSTGRCERLHGHNWKVEAEVEATALDEIGMAIDFKRIKAATRKIASQLDHHYLNDIEPFTRINPTAENIAAWFFQQLSDVLNSDTIRVCAITLWETERARVRYTRS